MDSALCRTQERAVFAECDQCRAHTFCQQRPRRFFSRGRIGYADFRQRFRLAFVGGHVVAQGIDRLPQLRGRGGIQDGCRAACLRDFEATESRIDGLFQLRKEYTCGANEMRFHFHIGG